MKEPRREEERGGIFILVQTFLKSMNFAHESTLYFWLPFASCALFPPAVLNRATSSARLARSVQPTALSTSSSGLRRLCSTGMFSLAVRLGGVGRGVCNYALLTETRRLV